MRTFLFSPLLMTVATAIRIRNEVDDKVTESVQSDFLAALLQYMPYPISKTLYSKNTTDMTKQKLMVPGGRKNMTIFTFDPKIDRQISKEISLRGTWEPDSVQKICEKWAQRTGHFLDVGANLGTFTLPIASCLQNKGKVIAVEGMPIIASHLEASIVENSLSNVALYNYAVGDDEAGNEIVMQLKYDNPGHSHVVTEQKDQTKGHRDIVVELTTLDAMYRSNPDFKKVLFMKMDIEGNEGKALKGAQEMFQENPPCYLMIELSPMWLKERGTPIESVEAALTRFGYNVGNSDLLEQHGEVKTILLEHKNLEACLTRVSIQGS